MGSMSLNLLNIGLYLEIEKLLQGGDQNDIFLK